MGLGRKGERVANTPMRWFPPSRGGRTVGDQPWSAVWEIPTAARGGKSLHPPKGLWGPETLLKDHLGRELLHQAALAGNGRISP